MTRDLLALRPISQFTQKTLSYLHSTKIEQMTKTMVIFKTGAIFLCCIRCDPIPRQTSVQRLAHTRNVTTCCCFSNDDGDGRVNVKTSIGLFRKTTSLHVHHAFLYISLLLLLDYDVKMPNFTFFGGRKQATMKFSFFF